MLRETGGKHATVVKLRMSSPSWRSLQARLTRSPRSGRRQRPGRGPGANASRKVVPESSEAREHRVLPEDGEKERGAVLDPRNEQAEMPNLLRSDGRRHQRRKLPLGRRPRVILEVLESYDVKGRIGDLIAVTARVVVARDADGRWQLGEVDRIVIEGGREVSRRER